MTNKGGPHRAGDYFGILTNLRNSSNLHQTFTKFPQTFTSFAKPSLCSPNCYHNTVAMMFLVVSLHLQVLSTTMLFKQAYGFLLSIHLQVLVTTVRCQ